MFSKSNYSKSNEKAIINTLNNLTDTYQVEVKIIEIH